MRDIAASLVAPASQARDPPGQVHGSGAEHNAERRRRDRRSRRDGTFQTNWISRWGRHSKRVARREETEQGVRVVAADERCCQSARLL